MILICAQCNTQFELDETLLGERGRKVKCSECGETWTQTPPHVHDVIEEEAEVVAEEPPAVEEPKEGPEDVEPDVTVTEKPEVIEEKEVSQPVSKPTFGKRQVTAYAIAASVFLVFIGHMFMNSASIMRKNPEAQSFYALFGIHMDIPGEGLVFEQIQAQIIKGSIHLKGKIINLESEGKDVPIIQASVKGHDGHDIEKWLVSVPEKTIGKEHSLTFVSEHVLHDTPHDDSGLQVDVRFVLASSIKTGEAGGGNIPAHPESESDHRNAHEASEESHPPVSSESHPEP